MLGVLQVYIFLSWQYILIECLIPHLNVRKIDNKVIARKRQDTLDMCRIFNEETEKMKYSKPNPNRQEEEITRRHRSKRSVGSISVNPALKDEDAERVEKIVDRIYDDLQEKGANVTYKKPKKQKGMRRSSNKTGRRFNFAPAVLMGPENSKEQKGVPEYVDTKQTRFKHGIVPYFIDSKTYDSHLAGVIIKAFDYIEKSTCIRLQRLRERPTDVDSLRNVVWLYITNPSGLRQCVHSNERTDLQGVQMIVFGYNCMSVGDIAHEIMHVLGFSHEHIRPDRDKYVSILWDNIKPGYKKFFEIVNKPVVENLPYDYTSVMHYPCRAFSRNGQYTIMTGEGIKIGQRERLSELDIEKIRIVYSNECVKRNREYLLKTCPTVVKASPTQKKATTEEIKEYFKERLWPYGVVNFKLRDKMEFSAEERDNINAVISHIEKETCIEFRDLTEEDDAGADYDASSGSSVEDPKIITLIDSSREKDKQENKIDPYTTENSLNLKQSDNEIKKSDDDNGEEARLLKLEKDKDPKENPVENTTPQTGTRKKRAAVSSPSRRHANNILVLARSADPGCVCPPAGKPSGTIVMKINSDCFNSVNDLLHVFVHVLGLDHQHNTHDRDSFLHIVWNQLTPDVRAEMQKKLPPAASVGFAYDYQSVMHYPWLQIKNGRTNIMYPIWNDGWAMGHWQGLSSIDVQKLNLLYFEKCTERKKHVEETESAKYK